MVKYSNKFIKEYLIVKGFDKTIVEFAILNASQDFYIQMCLDMIMDICDDEELMRLSFYSLESYILEDDDIKSYNC